MITFLTVVHVLVCLFLILVVLLQAGKGGGMGIAFGGGGGSQTVFGSSGAGNFLTRLTSVTAFLFLLTSLGLAHFSSQQDSRRLQRLAERKSVEKKADDDRANKLKVDLERAREAVQSTTGTGATAPAATAPVGTSAATPAPAGTGTSKAGKPELTAPAHAISHRRKHAVAPPPGAAGESAPAAPKDDGQTAPAAPAPAPAGE
jgi:preprotein translocase subunit SecG